MKKAATVLAAVVALALGSNGTANAGSITYYFTSDHCTWGCLTGQTNGGSILITDLGGGVLSFDVELANGNQFVNGGFGASFGFNLTGISSVKYTNIVTASSWTIPGGNPQSAGSLHMDGTGFFSFGLDAVGNGGSDPQGNSLTFSIEAAGLTLSNLSANDGGQFFAADVLSGTTGKTGAIDASTTTVPDGGTTVALLGGALLGLGMLRRRFGK